MLKIRYFTSLVISSTTRRTNVAALPLTLPMIPMVMAWTIPLTILGSEASFAKDTSGKRNSPKLMAKTTPPLPIQARRFCSRKSPH